MAAERVVTREKSKDDKLPASGDVCLIKHSISYVDGRVVNYFDADNIEYVLVNLGPIHVIRKSSEIVKPGGQND